MVRRSRKPGHRPDSVQKLMRNCGANPNSTFNRMLVHARELGRLDQQLASMLDPGLAPHCQVAELRHHCLILACSQAAYATRIRMVSPQLLESFTEAGEYGIERIETRIAPVNHPQQDVRQHRSLPASAIQALGRFAADSGDAEIQSVFDRINNRLDKK